jgi:hypothetical protein
MFESAFDLTEVNVFEYHAMFDIAGSSLFELVIPENDYDKSDKNSGPQPVAEQ